MKNNKLKIVALITLVLGVATLSVGFAVFSKTLNVGTTNVSTTTRTNVFDTAIHYDQTTGVVYDNTNASNVTNVNTGTLGTDTWSGVSFTIDSNSATANSGKFTATIVNDSDYTGYFQGVTSNNGVIECTPVGDTDPTLVANACTKMRLSMTFMTGPNGYPASLNSTTPLNAVVYDSQATFKITNSQSNTVRLTFTYNNDGTLPDGQFTVTLPAITFSYASTPSNPS